MWIQMFILLVVEGLPATTIAYVIGGAVVRNIFWPKIATRYLVIGYLFALIVTPVIAMMFANGNTWGDASDALISSSWKSVVVALAIVAVIRASRNDEAVSSTGDNVPDVSADTLEEGADDPEIARQLLSIKEQMDVGLLSKQEAAEKRARLLTK